MGGTESNEGEREPVEANGAAGGGGVLAWLASTGGALVESVTGHTSVAEDDESEEGGMGEGKKSQ
jgi:hypothetical protein